jgi:hypothetical protein
MQAKTKCSELDVEPNAAKGYKIETFQRISEIPSPWGHILWGNSLQFYIFI